MIVYRLAKSQFKNDLSGQGAEKSGGRWNSKGKAMVYTSASRALCLLEVAVHIPLHLIPEDYWLITIDVPGIVPLQKLAEKDLPVNWRSVPPVNSTQLLGDAFLKEGRFAVLQVPSVIVAGEFNYLLQPAHADMKKIKILKTEPFSLDGRLFR